MLVLLETSAGFSLFKIKDGHKFENSPNLFQEFSTLEKAHQMVELDQSIIFKNVNEAVKAYIPIKEGKVSKKIGHIIKKASKKGLDLLCTTNKSLAQTLQSKYGVTCRADTRVATMVRGIRQHLSSFIPELPQASLEAMQLGLAHSLNRYKFKVNPAKIDVMVVNAIHSLEDLDKEINNYYMRVREMYSWHFPELGKIITDNVAFVKLVLRIGQRDNASTIKLDDIIPEELIDLIRNASLSSMGSDFEDSDLFFISKLCTTVLDSIVVRDKMHDYVRNRMTAIAPNLTDLIGELMGAKLLAHAGTLLNLAKYPASTIQILGAEKALFRALKARKPTPKYGLIYHASLVTQASNEKRGQMARQLACKTALCARLDALTTSTALNKLTEKGSDDEKEADDVEAEEHPQFGVQFRSYLEWSLKQQKDKFANRPMSRPSFTPRGGRTSAPNFSQRNVPYDSGKDWQEKPTKRPFKQDDEAAPAEIQEEPKAKRSLVTADSTMETSVAEDNSEVKAKKEKKKKKKKDKAE